MGFQNVRIIGEEGLHSIEEISKRSDLDKIRGQLLCPTPGCTAHLSYVSIFPPYIKRRNLSVHSSFCLYANSDAVTVQRRVANQKRFVAMNASQTYSRLDAMGDRVFPETAVKRPRLPHKPRKRTKTIAISGEGEGYTNVATRDGITQLDGGVIKETGPHVRRKGLNEILQSDQGRVMNIPAKLVGGKRVGDQRYIFEIQQIDGDKTGTLLLSHDFFSRNVVGLDTWLDLLVEKANDPKYDVRIAFLGQLINYSSTQFEVFNDYGFKLWARGNGIVRNADPLPLFYDYFSRQG